MNTKIDQLLVPRGIAQSMFINFFVYALSSLTCSTFVSCSRCSLLLLWEEHRIVSNIY